MRKRIAALLFLGWLIIPAGMARAESPVLVSHTLTGYNMGTDKVVLNYTLTVKNVATRSISNLTLTYVPFMIVSKEQITLNIENLDPKTEAQVPFTITTPILLDQSKFSGQPLFWTGTYADGNGNQIQFPVNSVQGGAL